MEKRKNLRLEQTRVSLSVQQLLPLLYCVLCELEPCCTSLCTDDCSLIKTFKIVSQLVFSPPNDFPMIILLFNYSLLVACARSLRLFTSVRSSEFETCSQCLQPSTIETRSTLTCSDAIQMNTFNSRMENFTKIIFKN